MRMLYAGLSIIATISFIGSILAIYTLFQLSGAVNKLNEIDLTTVQNPALDLGFVKDVVPMLQGFILLGFGWSITVAITSLAVIYIALQRFKNASVAQLVE